MIQSNDKIQALLSLMDDTDMEVYSIVTEQICQYGKGIIPHLENLWENMEHNEVQERIELLIHQIQYNDLESELLLWKEQPSKLIDGAILAARFQYPDLCVDQFQDKILQLWKTVWLEINDHLSSLEQLHILNSILYHFYKLEGTPYNHDDIDCFLLNKVLEKKKGNALSNGILFQIVAEQIGLPVKTVHIPKHYLLAFFARKNSYWPSKGFHPGNILFFIDAMSGNVYNRQDMMKYLEDNGCLVGDRLFSVMRNDEIISYLLREMAACFDNVQYGYKRTELLRLADILSR
ncbi:MAG: transglutaminase family protein [Chitinophagaceae bacterium]